MVYLLHRHVRARQVHVGDQSVLVLRPQGQFHGEVGGAAPGAPGEVDEQRLGGLHAPEPVHQVLDSLGRRVALSQKNISYVNSSAKIRNIYMYPEVYTTEMLPVLLLYRIVVLDVSRSSQRCFSRKKVLHEKKS